MLREQRAFARLRCRRRCSGSRTARAAFGFQAGRKRVFLSCAYIGAIRHGLVSRDEVMLAIANQVGAAHGFQGVAQQRPVVRVVITQKRLLSIAMGR